ncbi:jg4556 [Pararge aegeria aegeria]|uniref:Jg4556 protein n=1 Tax=Pararge aegeria aegeria TaxID=348720 RepID=A0A8S4RS96_9NEOP|nr:jg4556 [Pararge aegeria aegeria]
MLRWGVSKMDIIRNEYIRDTFKVAKILEYLTGSRLRWNGHVMRRDDDHTKKVMNIEERRIYKRRDNPQPHGVAQKYHKG